MRIYFDNAASTPIDPPVLAAMTAALENLAGNPSSIHAEGRSARAAIERARREVAHLLNASIGEIFFTSGGTESSNMALQVAVRDLGVRRIISTRTEHHCVLHPLERLAIQGLEVVYLQQNLQGQPDLDQLADLLALPGPPTLVSLMHANNEIGTLLPLGEVAACCQQYGAFLHSDTVQTLGFYPFNLASTPIHFLTGSAHKFHGPKGIGFVYISNKIQVGPFIDGGGQERNMRGGTENTAGIIGLAKALELAYAELPDRRAKIEQVQQALLASLLENFSDLEMNGDPLGAGHYKILSVSFPASPKAELLLLNLDIAGISVSGGSACTSGAEAGSHVMDALRPGSLRKTIRFSFSHHNTLSEVHSCVEKLKQLLPP